MGPGFIFTSAARGAVYIDEEINNFISLAHEILRLQGLMIK